MLVDNLDIIKFEYNQVSTLVSIINCEGKILLIDTGTKNFAKDSLLPWFKKNYIDLDQLYMIINTHTHGDHIGGNSVLKKENNKILIAVHELAIEKMKNPYEAGLNIRKKYQNLVPLLKPEWLPGMGVDRSLKDNEVLYINNTQLRIIYTPGHDIECISIYEPETKTLFSGDSIQGGGTATTGIAFYQNFDSYKDTLKRIASMDINNLVMGHSFYPSEGIIIGKDKVKDFLNFSMQIVEDYDKQIKDIIKKNYDLLSITKELIMREGFYKNPPFIFLSMHTVDSHLKRDLKN